MPNFKTASISLVKSSTRLRKNVLDLWRSDEFSALQKWARGDAAAPREFARALQARQIRSYTAEGFRSAKGFAQQVLDSKLWEDAGLNQLAQLGSLQALAPTFATREDYIAIQLGILLRMKQRLPQLALGAPPRLFDLEMSRLELAQTWCIVLNMGHLFGTFATERGLLYQLHHSPSERREFLLDIESELRDACQVILDKQTLHRFYYVIAAWRISRAAASQTRSTLLTCLKAFLEAEETDDREVFWAYQRSRQFAYNRLHELMGIGAPPLFEAGEDVIDDLLGSEDFNFHEHSDEDNLYLRLLDAHDLYRQRAFFTTERAAARVFSHLSEFNQWWEKRRSQGTTVSARVDALFRLPHDWPQVQKQSLKSFVRLELPGSENDWLQYVDAWRTRTGDWGKWRFLISPVPRARGLVCDVYRTSTFSASACLCIAEQLATTCSASWQFEANDAIRRLWRSVASFGKNLLSLALNDSVVIRLVVSPARSPSIGYAILGPNPRAAVDRLKHFLGNLSAPQRRGELQAVAETVLAKSCSTRPCLIMLAQVRILDADSGRDLGEVDGLWADFEPTGIRWHFLEHKGGARGTGRGQLRALLSHLRMPCVGPTDAPVTSGRVSYATLVYPDGEHVERDTSTPS